MIRFRQKNFIAPLAALGMGSSAMGALNLGMAGTSLIGMKQSADQAKDAERQAEEQKEAIERQTKALNKIAREAKKNPELAQKVVQQKQMSETRIKLFAAIPPGTVKNLGGFAKDLWKTQKGNVKSVAKTGLEFGAMGYAGNRIVTSLKDHDEGHDEKNKSFLKKAAIGTALVGGGILGARKGVFGKSAQNFMTTGKGASALNAAKDSINPIVRDLDPRTGKPGAINKLSTAGKIGMNGLFIGLPVVGYLSQRQQIKDQAKQTEKAYSEDSDTGGAGKKLLKIGAGVLGTAGTFALARHGKLGGHAQRFTGNIIANTGGLMRSAGLKSGDKVARSGAQTYAQGVAKKGPISSLDLKLTEDKKFRQVTAPARISGGVNKAASFIGFYGKGGTHAVQRTANSLAQSNNEISKKVGTFMQDHKTLANLGAGVGGVAAGTSIMSAAGKPFKIFDKHAYDYEEQQNQQVN